MAATQFLVTGMFRSGTTFCARVLNANRHIICASDPFAPVFKAYRNTFGRAARPDFDTASPLHDSYLDAFQNGLFLRMQASSFDVALDPSALADLVEVIRVHSTAYSPIIHEHLHLMGGKDFSELFQSGLRVIEKSYPKAGHQAVGFKEVWVDEFAPHFLKLASGAKVIHVVRDPRAVVASNYASGTHYPLLFLARQWRKLATLAWVNAARSNSVKIIKYEDLVTQPRETALAICDFLGVDFDENMTRISELKDGANQPWHQNSSYKDISSDAKAGKLPQDAKKEERWRSALPAGHIRLVEKLCCFEMKLLGYHFVTDAAQRPMPDEGLLFADDAGSLADWVKPYSNYDYCTEMLAENARYELMRSKASVGEAVEKRLALDPSAYRALVSGWAAEPAPARASASAVV
ncbi:MAG: sulfotransferase [Pseudomonadota bacterium]